MGEGEADKLNFDAAVDEARREGEAAGRSMMTAEVWNELYPVGVPVRYWPVMGDGKYRDTITRGQAWTLGDGHPVVTIQGQPGGVSLYHLAVRVSHAHEVDAPSHHRRREGGE